MKIIIEIDAETRFTLDAPAGFFLENLPKVFEGVELGRKIVKQKPDGVRPPKLPRFVCSTLGGTISREIVAADAFTAAECFAGLILPSSDKKPWVHIDRDYEKLRHFGDRFSHRVVNGYGIRIPVIVKEVR